MIRLHQKHVAIDTNKANKEITEIISSMTDDPKSTLSVSCPGSGMADASIGADSRRGARGWGVG